MHREARLFPQNHTPTENVLVLLAHQDLCFTTGDIYNLQPDIQRRMNCIGSTGSGSQTFLAHLFHSSCKISTSRNTFSQQKNDFHHLFWLCPPDNFQRGSEPRFIWLETRIGQVLSIIFPSQILWGNIRSWSCLYCNGHTSEHPSSQCRTCVTIFRWKSDHRETNLPVIQLI